MGARQILLSLAIGVLGAAFLAGCSKPNFDEKQTAVSSNNETTENFSVKGSSNHASDDQNSSADDETDEEDGDFAMGHAGEE